MVAYLKFYSKEHSKYYEAYHIFLTTVEAKRLVKKLTRHFKFTIDIIRIYGSRQSGFSSYSRRKIKIPHSPSIGLLIHELSHQYDQQLLGRSRSKHDKKLSKIISKFHKYCSKKNYWRVIKE